MPFEKGHKKVGGRKKGTLSKAQQSLREKADELGIDPFEILLLFAQGDWEALGYTSAERVVNETEGGALIYEDTIPPQLRQKSAKDAAEYLYPKRKAVEVSGPDGKDPFKTFAELVAGVAESDDANPENA